MEAEVAAAFEEGEETAAAAGLVARCSVVWARVGAPSGFAAEALQVAALVKVAGMAALPWALARLAAALAKAVEMAAAW